jgi:hypothetical protein
MEIESIAVICLITLVVLVVQIIVTLRVFLYLHLSHRNDEEHNMQNLALKPQPDSVQDEDRPPSRHEPETLTVPGPAYPSSSRYSVRTDISNSSFVSDLQDQPRAPRPWDGRSPADGRRGLKNFHSDSASESGTGSYNPMGCMKKHNILSEVWTSKP